MTFSCPRMIQLLFSMIIFPSLMYYLVPMWYKDGEKSSAILQTKEPALLDQFEGTVQHQANLGYLAAIKKGSKFIMDISKSARLLNDIDDVFYSTMKENAHIFSCQFLNQCVNIFLTFMTE